MVYGDWPENQVDHIDGDPSNNKISNLRPATNKGNGRNAKKHSRNKSGLMGVGWLKSLEKWRVRIGTTHIGVANDFFDACCLRKAAEIEHGYHKNHGREI
jgi:hypothetical protein